MDILNGVGLVHFSDNICYGRFCVTRRLFKPLNPRRKAVFWYISAIYGKSYGKFPEEKIYESGPLGKLGLKITQPPATLLECACAQAQSSPFDSQSSQSGAAKQRHSRMICPAETTQVAESCRNSGKQKLLLTKVPNFMPSNFILCFFHVEECVFKRKVLSKFNIGDLRRGEYSVE